MVVVRPGRSGRRCDPGSGGGVTRRGLHGSSSDTRPRPGTLLVAEGRPRVDTRGFFGRNALGCTWRFTVTLGPEGLGRMLWGVGF